MLLDDELGMISDVRSNASVTADADAELEPSSKSHSNARDVEHGANAVPEAAGAADTLLVVQQPPKASGTVLTPACLPCTRPKKRRAPWARCVCLQ
jgi:hypothetical protein